MLRNLNFSWLRRNELFATTNIPGFNFIHNSKSWIEMFFWYSITVPFSILTLSSVNDLVSTYLSNPTKTFVRISSNTSSMGIWDFNLHIILPYVYFSNDTFDKTFENFNETDEDFLNKMKQHFSNLGKKLYEDTIESWREHGINVSLDHFSTKKHFLNEKWHESFTLHMLYLYRNPTIHFLHFLDKMQIQSYELVSKLGAELVNAARIDVQCFDGAKLMKKIRGRTTLGTTPGRTPMVATTPTNFMLTSHLKFQKRAILTEIRAFLPKNVESLIVKARMPMMAQKLSHFYKSSEMNEMIAKISTRGFILIINFDEKWQKEITGSDSEFHLLPTGIFVSKINTCVDETSPELCQQRCTMEKHLNFCSFGIINCWPIGLQYLRPEFNNQFCDWKMRYKIGRFDAKEPFCLGREPDYEIRFSHYKSCVSQCQKNLTELCHRVMLTVSQTITQPLSNLRYQIAKLEVRLKKEAVNFPEFIKEYEMTVSDFVANLGGLIDVWLGMSIISVIHVMVYVVKQCIYAPNRQTKTGRIIQNLICSCRNKNQIASVDRESEIFVGDRTRMLEEKITEMEKEMRKLHHLDIIRIRTRTF